MFKKNAESRFFGVAPLDLNSTALGLGVKAFLFPKKTHFYIFDMSIIHGYLVHVYLVHGYCIDTRILH